MSWRFQTHSVTPRREKSLPKRCSTQAVEGRSTTTRRRDEWCILGLVMFRYWCDTVVLDRYLWYLIYWIVIYCICIYCYLYIVWRLFSQEGRQNRKKLKNSLCSLVPRRTFMFVEEPTNIRPTWHQGQRGSMWHTFVGQVEPTNVRVLGSSVPHGRRM
jgi:hypothetical protein